ncbi:MAG: putative toxin-antitoxin system toxin component, PIN family [Acidiferrobacterales bacterium]
MRAVLDTNVVASGFLWGGAPPRQLLQAAREQKLQLYTSTPLLLELTDILGRAKFVRKRAAAQLSVDQLVERYSLLTTVVHPAVIAPTILDDPDDDQVLAGALAAKTEIIVSGDRHLLDLKAYRGVRMVRVAEAVKIIA